LKRSEESKKPEESKPDVTERRKAIQIALDAIEKQHGKGSIMKMSQKVVDNVPVISTGSMSLDNALGVGGVPKGRIMEIYGPEGGGKCVTPDTIVFSEEGMLPIGYFGDVSKLGFQKKEIGIFSSGFEDKTSHFYSDGLRDTKRIISSYGYTVEGTLNHKVWIIDKEEGLIFRSLGALKKGDYVAIQRGQGYFGSGQDFYGFKYVKNKLNGSGKEFDFPLFMTSDLARLLGYLVGDGCCTNTGLNKNCISMSIGDLEVEKDYTRVCNSVFGESPKVTVDKRGSLAKTFRVHNAKARSFLEYIGLKYSGAGGKEIPYSVMKEPEPIVAEFLRGLFETDGCFSDNDIEYCTKSKKLSEQLRVVLLNFGIVCRTKARKMKGYPDYYYYMYISGARDKELFCEKIGFISERKQNKLVEYIKNLKKFGTRLDVIPFANVILQELFDQYRQNIKSTTRKTWKIVYDYLPNTKKRSAISYPRLERILKEFSEGKNLTPYKYLEKLLGLNIFWDKIVSIEDSESVVVDFSVPDSEAFFGNGFVNHNTTMALEIIAQAQKAGGVAAFIDAEHALNMSLARSIGVNVDDLYLSQPEFGEQALEIVETLVRSGGMDVIVVDSVAALTPKAEIEGEMGDPTMGVQARLMSQAMRKLTAAVSNSKTCLIFINQLRMKIGVMFGNPETTTGGNALKFYASVRLDVRRIEAIKDGTTVTGNRLRVKVVKNKLAPPFKEAQLSLIFGKGIDKVLDLVDFATELGVIQKSGSWYSYREERLGQGSDAVVVLLRGNEKLLEEIKNATLDMIKKKG
jgi:recombination protein RecA